MQVTPATMMLTAPSPAGGATGQWHPRRWQKAVLPRLMPTCYKSFLQPRLSLPPSRRMAKTASVSMSSCTDCWLDLGRRRLRRLEPAATGGGGRCRRARQELLHARVGTPLQLLQALPRGVRDAEQQVTEHVTRRSASFVSKKSLAASLADVAGPVQHHG